MDANKITKTFNLIDFLFDKSEYEINSGSKYMQYSSLKLYLVAQNTRSSNRIDMSLSELPEGFYNGFV